MRARWVSERVCSPPVLFATVVASWWPGKFLRVSTVQTDIQWREKMIRMAEGKGTPPPNFLTQVFRCRGALNSYTAGLGSLRNPLYEREYMEQSDAENGHRETVELLAAGKLRL
ncbi:MAG TPA: hypothetical protein VMV72_10265 [Verrucomicrobiae bacterium]|nr:hypothetical protein [Verrucomicrobiae bacterium]